MSERRRLIKPDDVSAIPASKVGRFGPSERCAGPATAPNHAVAPAGSSVTPPLVAPEQPSAPSAATPCVAEPSPLVPALRRVLQYSDSARLDTAP